MMFMYELIMLVKLEKAALVMSAAKLISIRGENTKGFVFVLPTNKIQLVHYNEKIIDL